MNFEQIKFTWYERKDVPEVMKGRVWRSDLGEYQLEVIHAVGDGMISWKVNNSGQLGAKSREEAMASAEIAARSKIALDFAIGDRARAALRAAGLEVVA